MKLKNILCLILALTCVLGTLCIGSGAEVNISSITESLEYEIIESYFDSYLFYAEFCSGYFSEGNAPSMDTVRNMLTSDVIIECDEYCVKPEDAYSLAVYEIPADIYESMAARYFVKNEALLVHMRGSSYYKTDKAEPYYRIEVGGGFGGVRPSLELCGLTVRESDGCILAYGYLVQDWVESADDFILYSPDSDDIEGVDYITLGRNYYDESGNIVFSYKPWKIVGAVRSAFSVNEEAVCIRLHSYEEISAIDLPPIPELDVTAPEEALCASFGGVAVIEKDTFAEGTVIGGEYVINDVELAAAGAALAGHGMLGGLFKIEASRPDGTPAEPKKPFTVCFDIPFGFCDDVKIYRLSDSNEVTELPTELIDGYLSVCTEINALGRYAVAGSLYGDANGDNDISLPDITLMLKYLASWGVDMNLKAGDVNADGDVSLPDITLMLKYLAGWDVYFGAQG